MSRAPLLYFAYGGNLHPERFRQIVPSAEVAGTAVLDEHELRFHKRSRDGSAKCDVVGCMGAQVHGVVYRLAASDGPRLDDAERGYDRSQVGVRLGATATQVFTYRARPDHMQPDLRPYDWYRDLVLAGARHHGFPASYVARIEAALVVQDPDPGRARDAAALLARLQ